MANFLIDIGNTVLKAAWADGITIGRTFRYQGEKKLDFILSCLEDGFPEKIIVCSSEIIDDKFHSFLEERCERLIVMDPLRKSYISKMELPSHIGADRIAAIVASRYLFNGTKCLIFDLGTMIYADLIEADGKYVEGYISPGFISRIRSVNRYSRVLPLIEMSDMDSFEKGSLEYSIKEGIASGIMFEIQGRMKDSSECLTIFTGGDSIYFAKRMKNPIFVVCNLVFIGLALLAERNEEYF